MALGQSDQSDYYSQTCHHKEISGIKILKYLLISTLSLLETGLVALSLHLTLNIISIQTRDSKLIYLLLDYGIASIIGVVALLAVVKENFFFLVCSAAVNSILAIGNLSVASYRWSIILLQFISAMFTFAYTLSTYLKMKFDIRRKKRLKRLELVRHGVRDGSMATHHDYDKLVLTNQWLSSHPKRSILNSSSFEAPHSGHTTVQKVDILSLL